MKEIVIKIEEETYNRIMNGWMPLHKAVNLMENVQKGTPLPKHHGRLIDTDDIAIIDEQFYVPSDYYVAENAIDNAPTIIERSDNE